MAKIDKSEFIKSAVTVNQYPEDVRPEVAFVGRSNVGKSTLINTLTNRKKLAKTSKTPGRTRLINFFLINDENYFVDLPGYGYAKVSKVEKEKWGKIIEDYFLNRPQLKKVMLLVDSRRAPSEDDILMYNFIKHYGFKVIIVGTKVDKLLKSSIKKNEKLIRDTLKLKDGDEVLLFSALKRMGIQELIDEIYVDLI